MSFISFAPVLGKRSRGADDLDSAINSKLAKTAPSVISELRSYRSLQYNPSQRILDDLPKPDLFLPISVLFGGFGEFLDAVNRPEDGFDLDVKRQQLELHVIHFAEEMTKFYDTETQRSAVGLYALD